MLKYDVSSGISGVPSGFTGMASLGGGDRRGASPGAQRSEGPSRTRQGPGVQRRGKCLCTIEQAGRQPGVQEGP